jgi:hypothetical protein
MTAGSPMPTLKSAKVRIRHRVDDPEGRLPQCEPDKADT